ncbi:hypothetical protein TrRE_jg12597, partial [Triparma retinervis]
LGYELEGDKLNAVFDRFKVVAEKKKGGLEDEDLEALVTDSAYTLNTHWTLKDLSVTTGMSGIPTATVTMEGPDLVSRFVAATGEGPVDAVYKAIDKLVGVSVTLETYGMQAVNEGIDALATTRVTVTPKEDGSIKSGMVVNAQNGIKQRQFSGAGSDGDVVVASARAYVSALNKLITWNKRRKEMSLAAEAKEGEEGEEGGEKPQQVGDGTTDVGIVA